MKEAFSLVLNKTVYVDEINHGDCSKLQVVCLECEEPTLLVRGKINNHIAHYRFTNRICDQRSKSSSGGKNGKNYHSKGQDFLTYFDTFNKYLIQGAGDPEKTSHYLQWQAKSSFAQLAKLMSNMSKDALTELTNELFSYDSVAFRNPNENAMRQEKISQVLKRTVKAAVTYRGNPMLTMALALIAEDDGINLIRSAVSALIDDLDNTLGKAKSKGMQEWRDAMYVDLIKLSNAIEQPLVIRSAFVSDINHNFRYQHQHQRLTDAIATKLWVLVSEKLLDFDFSAQWHEVDPKYVTEFMEISK